MKGLLERGVDINGADHRGMRPLHMATMSGTSDCVNLLLANGASPNPTSTNGLLVPLTLFSVFISYFLLSLYFLSSSPTLSPFLVRTVASPLGLTAWLCQQCCKPSEQRSQHGAGCQGCQWPHCSSLCLRKWTHQLCEPSSCPTRFVCFAP